MTFSPLLQRPRAELLIGAHQHAALISEMPNRVRRTLRRSKRACNVCGADPDPLPDIHPERPAGEAAPESREDAPWA